MGGGKGSPGSEHQGDATCDGTGATIGAIRGKERANMIINFHTQPYRGRTLTYRRAPTGGWRCWVDDVPRPGTFADAASAGLDAREHVRGMDYVQEGKVPWGNA